MPGEDYPNRFVPHALYDPATAGLFGQQPKRPPRATLRWRTTHHRHDRGLLAAIELGRRLRSRVLRQRMLKTGPQVSLADPRYLPRVPSHRNRCRTYGLTAVEKQQHLNPPPHPRRKLRPPSSYSLQLGPVRGRELQPLESRPGPHSTL